MGDITVLFRSGDYNYARSRVIVKGLRKNDVNVIEWKITTSKLASTLKLEQIPNLFSRYIKLIRKYTSNYDIMIVGFPEGRYDIPVGKLLTLIDEKILVFDALISEYEKVLDEKIVCEKSLNSILYFYADKIPCLISDLILLDTNEHINYFSKTFGIKKEKFKRVFIGSDDDVFYPRNQNRKDGKFVITFYGFFAPLHGVEFVIHAARKLEKYEDIKFEILGARKKHYNLKIDKMKNIAFRPPIPYDLLPNFIGEGDVCLGIFGKTPKAQRVVPNKVYEALAMRKPLITGDTPAIREVGIRDRKHALLVPMGDAQAISDAIMELKEDKELRDEIAWEGYELFREKFTPKVIGEDLKKCLIEILEKW